MQAGSVCQRVRGSRFLLRDVSFYFGASCVWVGRHITFPPSLALFFSFVSFGLPSSPIFVSLKLSPFQFPPFHSSSLHFSRFLNLVLPPAALSVHLSPFSLLIRSPSLSSPLGVCRGHLWAACSLLNLLQANRRRLDVSLDLRWNGVLLGFVTGERESNKF